MKTNNIFISSYNSKHRDKFIKLVKKFGYNVGEIIVMINKNNSEKEIYNKLLESNKTKDTSYGSEDNTEKNNRKAEIIQSLYNLIDEDKLELNNYLDIGCNRGELTVLIRDKLKINNENTYCIDIGSFGGRKIESVKGLEYKIYDGINIPYDDKKFNLITILHVIHHVMKMDLLIKEINRVLMIGGIIIIKEHDSLDKDYVNIIDLEHLLWGTIEGTKYDDFKKDYFSKYYSKNKLKELFYNNGFRECKIKNNNFDIPIGITRTYHSAFIKEKDILIDKKELINYYNDYINGNINEVNISSFIKKKAFPYTNINYNNLKMTNQSIFNCSGNKLSEFMFNILKEKNPKKSIITDCNAGIGSDTIRFALYFNKINSIEKNQENYKCLLNNIKEYNLNNKIITYNGNNLDILSKLKQDVIYIDLFDINDDSLINNEMNIYDFINNFKDKTKFFLFKLPFDFKYKNKNKNFKSEIFEYINNSKTRKYKLLLLESI